MVVNDIARRLRRDEKMFTGLLLVMLDSIHIAHASFVRVQVGMPTRPPLAQQVPALIEADFNRLYTRPLLLIQMAFLRRTHKFVLFIHQLFYALQDLTVVHVYLFLSRL